MGAFDTDWAAPKPGAWAGYGYNPQSPYQNTTNTNIQSGTMPGTQNSTSTVAGGGAPSVIPKVPGSASGSEWSWMGKTNADGSKSPGVLGLGMSAINTGVNAWMGMKGLDLAEENLDFQKDSWERRFAMQQDQYYRKLNAKRSINNSREGMTQAEATQLNNHYDSGVNLQGSYTPDSGSINPTAAQVAEQTKSDWNRPTVPASDSGMLPTANPFSTASMLSRGSGKAIGNIMQANSPMASNSAMLGSQPVTASNAAIRNTNVGPDGKRRVKKKDDVGSRQVNPDAQ